MAAPTGATARKTTVTVLYNGQTKELPFQGHQQVNALLQHALKSFSVTGAVHLMSLFDLAGAELSEHSSVTESGVKAGDELILRQSVVKGG